MLIYGYFLANLGLERCTLCITLNLIRECQKHIEEEWHKSVKTGAKTVTFMLKNVFDVELEIDVTSKQ